MVYIVGAVGGANRRELRRGFYLICWSRMRYSPILSLSQGEGRECWGKQQLFHRGGFFEESDGSLELFPSLLKLLYGEMKLLECLECLLKACWLS